MTNAEKYEKVFGLEPNPTLCPSNYCCDCPITPDVCKHKSDKTAIRKWWNSEYKGRG